jgi:hypothetical protein
MSARGTLYIGHLAKGKAGLVPIAELYDVWDGIGHAAIGRTLMDAIAESASTQPVCLVVDGPGAVEPGPSVMSLAAYRHLAALWPDLPQAAPRDPSDAEILSALHMHADAIARLLLADASLARALRVAIGRALGK